MVLGEWIPIWILRADPRFAHLVLCIYCLARSRKKNVLVPTILLTFSLLDVP